MIDRRLLLCAAISVGGHCVFAESLALLPARPATAIARPIQVAVVEAPRDPPPPPPEPPPPEPAPEPPPRVHEAPRKTTPKIVRRAETPVDTPPVDTAPTTAATTTTPVFGVQMSSSSTATGPAIARGNTTRTAPTTGTPGVTEPLAAPAAAYEVTRMPLPLGRCSGKYTTAAKDAGIEGVVVLDLIVDESGRAREITVVEPLTHGLTEAAVTALRACRFTPGERSGAPVAVRVRGFKIRFVLQDG